jgi:hypothetical protein
VDLDEPVTEEDHNYGAQRVIEIRKCGRSQLASCLRIYDRGYR